MKRKAQHILMLILILGGLKAHSQDENLNPLDYFLQMEIDQANTAKEVDYLTDEEKDIYLYTNLVRLFPKKFYEFYKAFVIAENKESLLMNNGYYTTLTKDLKSRDAVDAVYPDAEMFELAKCWAIESGEKGVMGHDREDCPKGHDGENCAYGVPAGVKNVMLLLIDYGIQNLGHRSNLLHPDWRGMGVAIRPHRDFGMCTVQDFSRTNDLMKEEERKRGLLILKRQEDFTLSMQEWDKDELEAADVNRSAKYLDELEKDFYFYINLMRINPKKFKTMIWDQGPFFDQLPDELENGVRRAEAYKTVSKWLESATQKEAFIPHKKRIAELKCVMERFLANNTSYSSCIKSGGSWRFSTYQSASNFNDIMNILLTPDDFQSIFSEDAIVALRSGEPGIKVIMKD